MEIVIKEDEKDKYFICGNCDKITPTWSADECLNCGKGDKLNKLT